MKRRLRLILGIAISLAAVYVVARYAGLTSPAELQDLLGRLWEIYRDANYSYIAPALLLLLLINWARAYRWRLLVHADQHLPLGRLFSIVNIGYLFNNILPAKAGELVRGYLVGRIVSGGMARALSSLLVERLLDVLVLVALALGLMLLVDVPPLLIDAGRLLGVVSACGVVALSVLARVGDRGLDRVWRLLGRVPCLGHPKVRRALKALLAGFHVLTVGKLLPGIVLWSLLIWLGYALFNYVILAVLRMTYLPFTAAAFVLCATGFAMVLPSSPGAVGVFETAAVLALSVYGVDKSQAIGYAFGLHSLTNIALIVLGLWGLGSEGLTYADIRRKAIDGDVGQGASLSKS